jgi:serine/threonine protein kinase
MAPPSERLKSLSGRYGPTELIELIGNGGMAAVYRAKHVESGKEFAVKIFDHENNSANSLDRFKREARIGAMLSHKACITVHGHGERDGTHYMVMDLVDGGDLKEKLKAEGGQLKWEVAAKYGADIAEALAFSHSKQIIHRDVKPANILLRKDGRVCLGDFGLALILGEGPHIEENRSDGIQILIGTPAYMAPEQFRRPNGVDRRADLYALGILLYELIAGERPFLGSNVKALQKEHQRMEAPFLSKRAKGLPRLLIELVDRLIAKKPDWRYESAEAVARDLRGIAAGSLNELTDDEIPTQSDSSQGFPILQVEEQSRVITTSGHDPVLDGEANHTGQSKILLKVLIGVLIVLFVGVLFMRGLSRHEKRYAELCEKAEIALEAKNYDRADKLYTDALRLFPRREKALRGLEQILQARDADK